MEKSQQVHPLFLKKVTCFFWMFEIEVMTSPCEKIPDNPQTVPQFRSKRRFQPNAMAKKGKKSHAARAKAKAEESTAAAPATGDARKGVKGISADDLDGGKLSDVLVILMMVMT